MDEEERLKLAVFIDFDNIQIGVKDTLGKDFDVSVVLEALKERGEVVSKTAYGDWSRAGETSRQMTQHAVQLVQRNVTPRGDKNGADINLALDALEMAFTRDHINTFVIVGGDSDFIALVEKLKQYDKRVYVVGGRQFTSGILQRNCHEFIAYENLLRSEGGSRPSRASRAAGRGAAETRPPSAALPNVQRALKVLAEREVAPQLGLLKSTLLQLDPTFSERDFGAGSFLEFIQKLQKAGLVSMKKTERGYLVEAVDTETGKEAPAESPEEPTDAAPAPAAAAAEPEATAPAESAPAEGLSAADSLALLQKAVSDFAGKAPNRPLYMRQVRQALRALDSRYDERQSGFRGLLDLLHQGQREGWLRLHRDRNGVWRVFPLSVPSAAAPAGAELVAEEAVAVGGEVPAAPTEPAAEAAPALEVVAEVAAPVEAPAPVAEEAAHVEAPHARRGRRPRGAKAGAKGGQRKGASRRKPRESTEA